MTGPQPAVARLFNSERCFRSAERFANAAYSLSTKLTGHPDVAGGLELVEFMPCLVDEGGALGFYVDGPPAVRDMAYVDAYVVMAALSLELYLKTLASVSSGKRHGHKLSELFAKLPDDLKHRAAETFKLDIAKSTRFDAIADHIRGSRPHFVWELPYILDLSATAFEEYRYAHDTHLGSFVGFREARIALRTEILALRPEWATLE